MTGPARLAEASADDAAGVVARHLRHGTSVTVLTGAGVSAASGVPTFRGPDGLVAAASARGSRPRRPRSPATRGWCGSGTTGGGSGLPACAPNDAHHVLARWSAWPGFTLVTQNVDGLHERAGTADVLCLHGSIWEVRCADGCTGGRAARRDLVAPLAEPAASLSPLPRPGTARRGVVRRVARRGRVRPRRRGGGLVRRLPHHRDVGGGLSGGRAGRGSQAARCDDDRDQPRRDAARAVSRLRRAAPGRASTSRAPTRCFEAERAGRPEHPGQPGGSDCR